MSWRPALVLDDGEAVIEDLGFPPVAAIGPYVVTLGLFEPFRRLVRYVLTDRRLLVLGGPPGFRHSLALPLASVQDASVKQNLWLAYVVVTTAGGSAGSTRMGPLRANDARRLAQHVLTARGAKSGL